MSPRPFVRWAARAAATGLALAAGAAAAAGCSDAAPSRERAAPTAPAAESLPAPVVLGAMRANVDLVAGTMTFEPIPAPGTSSSSSSASSSPSARGARAPGAPLAAIYGDQNVTVRLSNTAVAVTIDPTTGRKRFTGNVTVTNLRPHPIGDEQGAATPPDTMGIFVFFSTEPIITAPTPCAGCTITVFNYHGVKTFDQPSRKYFFYPERLPANGSSTARTWVFDASPAVTNFYFDVLLSAAWPPPNETRWAVRLDGDSLPDTQEEPRWRIEQAGVNSATATGGMVTISVNNNATRRYFRRDSVASAGNAYIETRMQLNSSNAGRPEGRIVIDDGVRHMALGVARASVWFSDANNTFLPGTPLSVPTAATAQNVYQLRKYGADSIVFYVNGTRGGAFSYAALPVTAYAGTAPLLIFGNRSLQGPSGSSWDYVYYEIGTPFP